MKHIATFHKIDEYVLMIRFTCHHPKSPKTALLIFCPFEHPLRLQILS